MINSFESNIKSHKQFILTLFALIVVGVFLYLPKVVDEFGWYNSSEFVLSAATNDIPHAPGYPLYIGLAKIAIKIFKEAGPSYAVNLLTSGISILGGVLFCVLFVANGFSLPVAFLAGTLLMCGRNYTEQSLTAEVYTLEICFILAGLIVGKKIQQGVSTPWLGFVAGLVGMLGVGHRPTFGLYTLTLILFVMASKNKFRPDKNFYAALIFGVLIGLLPTLHLYASFGEVDGILFDPMLVGSFSDFLKFFTGTIYSGGLFVFSFSEVLGRFLYFIWFVTVDSTNWVIVGSLALFYFQPHKEHLTLVKALSWILFLNLFLILNYNAFEAHTMLLPSILSLTAFAAMSVDLIKYRFIKELCCFTVSLFVIISSYTSIKAPNSETRDYVKRSISSLPSGSTVILSNDVEFKPYYYLRRFNRLREDIVVALADRVVADDMSRFEDALRNDRLFSSLIYPENSRENLIKSYSLEAFGYFYKIIEYGGVSETAFVLPNNGVLSPVFEILPSEFRINEARPGEFLSYSYQLCVDKADFKKTLVLTVLVDETGELQARDGILVGHDIHFPADFTCEKYNEDFVNLDFNRTIVLPYDLNVGKYRLLSVACIVDDAVLKEWLNYMPDSVNLFNLNGFLEVFTLKYGLSCRKLVKKLSFAQLFKNAKNSYFVQEPYLLDEFVIRK